MAEHRYASIMRYSCKHEVTPDVESSVDHWKKRTLLELLINDSRIVVAACERSFAILTDDLPLEEV